MKISNFAIVLFIAVLFCSCRQEVLQQSTNEQTATVIADATVKSGRLYFLNKESLTNTYEKFKNVDDEVISNYIDRKGIISLRPIVTKQNEELINKRIGERINLLKKNKRFMASKNVSVRITNKEEIIDEIDDLEEIVGDDTYGAFLNSNAEIQVADEIFKYTDAGLFIVKVENYESLENYLSVKKISDNLMYPTETTIRENYVKSMPSNELVPVTNEINYYNFMIAPIDVDDGSGGSEYTGGGSGGTPGTSSNTAMYNFINSLPNCNTYHTWLQSLFGKSDMCVDRYENRYRVKTKAFNYNYFLVYNLGVKVKHQYKGWTGLWRKENADQIRLGVHMATFAYDYSSYFNPKPNTRVTTIYDNNNRYMFDASTFWTPTYYPGIYTISGFSMSDIPKLFQDDYYIEDILPFMPTSSSIGLIDQGLYSAMQAGNQQLTASNLNNLFWTEIVKRSGNFLQSIGKSKTDNNLTYSYNATSLGKIVVAKTLHRDGYFTNNLEKTFDWGFLVGINIGSDGHISANLSGGGLKRPQDYRVLMYGIVKRNGQWHGSKINTGI